MTDRQLIKYLTQFGFTRAQAKVYVAGLELAQTLMAPLARRAGVKRTTVYYLMNELLRRGFFAKRKIGKRNYYFAASPRRMLEMVHERRHLVLKILPALEKVCYK